MITPIKYPGSKVQLADRIISLIPTQHQCFVEVFGGSGAVLFNKPRSPVEVYNDVNEDLVTLMRVLRDRKDEFNEKLKMTPYSRAEYLNAEEVLKHATYKDELEHAVAVFIARNQSYSGRVGWSFSKTADESQHFYTRVEAILDLAKRLNGVQIECKDFKFILKSYDSKDTVFYLDPPYVTETRSAVIYKNEFTDLHHVDLVQALRYIKGTIILSGYDHPLYKPLDSFLERVEVEVKMSMSHKTKSHSRGRVEVLWHTPQVVFEQLKMF